jgi:uncharacterized hydrophobic protein (TIGR00271 family)
MVNNPMQFSGVSSLIGRMAALYPLWRNAMTRGIEHERVVARIVEESGWTPRYAFMILMSAGIAELGLLLSSPAVVIGAMLISPLMNPILGLGFSLALIDARELRRSLIALLVGGVSAVLFTAMIVALSPLKAVTAEILARTRPNLFDLLVALFAALAGSFAIIRGRGETIVGVAIATALMPPLAAVGFGLATWNVPVLTGSLALFTTNFVTIALSATLMARLYGFGRSVSSRQTWLQTGLLIGVFVVMAVPLAFALGRIANEALTVSQVRSYLSTRFGAEARVSQLDVEVDARPLSVRAVVIAPKARAQKIAELRQGLQDRLGRPVKLQVDQLLLAGAPNSLAAQKASLQQSQETADALAKRHSVAQAVAVASGAPPDAVLVDDSKRVAQATAAVLPGASLTTYRALEARTREESDGWDIRIVPPLQPLPPIRFGRGKDTLDAAAQENVATAAWAARRWGAVGLAVPGLDLAPPSRANLNQRRALAVAQALRAAGVIAAPARGGGQSLILAPTLPRAAG